MTTRTTLRLRHNLTQLHTTLYKLAGLEKINQNGLTTNGLAPKQADRLDPSKDEKNASFKAPALLFR